MDDPASTRAGAPPGARGFVSPLRNGHGTSPAGDGAGLRPAEPMPSYSEPAGAALAGPERDDEPALPDEARGPAAHAAQASTTPASAGPDSVLHVRFSAGAAADRLVTAMEEFRTLLRDRPGATRVVLHVPASAGEALPMELRRGVAYDAELLAEIRRRLGTGLVELQLN